MPILRDMRSESRTGRVQPRDVGGRDGNTGGAGFTILHNFGEGGGIYAGRLLASNGVFYATGWGPAADIVFTIKRAGTGFARLHELDGTNGNHLGRQLVALNGFLYGTTGSYGCSAGCGTIYRLAVSPSPRPPLLSIGGASALERPESDAVFTVRSSWPSASTVTVAYGTEDGNAAAGVDFVATSGTLTFGPGQPSQTVRVSVLTDNIREGPETFFVNLSNPTNATIVVAQGRGRIVEPRRPGTR